MAFLYMVKHNNIVGAVYDAISKHSVLAIILVINLYLLQCVHGSSFSSSENYDRHSRDINIKTLPPDLYSDGYSHDHGNDFYASEVRNSADALLSNWDGDHWASLDAEQDMVNLQWSSNSEEITFQVRLNICRFQQFSKQYVNALKDETKPRNIFELWMLNTEQYSCFVTI